MQARPHQGPHLSDQTLRLRVQELKGLQQPCRLCPHRCRAERRTEPGRCGQSLQLSVAAVCAHRGEEPALTGSGGAGTVFLAGCPLRCLFCQNHRISRGPADEAWQTTAAELASRLLELQRAGCHNIEWVSPGPHLPQLVEALRLARRQGLTLPVVHNGSGFERVRVLRLLEGIVDVYLPDAKYASEELARELSGAPGYVTANRGALREMWRQVGPLELDERGIAVRGLLVRHLVLPGHLDNTRSVLSWLARELGPRAWISLMAQYDPAPLRRQETLPLVAALKRRLTRREHRLAVEALLQAGLELGWVQQRASAPLFRPDFTRPDPFGHHAAGGQGAP